MVGGSKSSFGRIQYFYLSRRSLPDSLSIVNQKTILRKRDRLAASLPDASDVLRGSLLQRIIRHRSGCAKCDRGEGHPVAVLAVGYPGRRIRQICLRKEQIAEVRQYAKDLKYPPGSLVYSGTNEDDFLYCLPNNKDISVCREMAKNMGFPKLEVGLSAMSKDDLADSLAYNSLMVQKL